MMIDHIYLDLAGRCQHVDLAAIAVIPKFTTEILAARGFRFAGFDDRTYVAAVEDQLDCAGSDTDLAGHSLYFALSLGDPGLAWVHANGFAYPAQVGQILHKQKRLAAPPEAVSAWLAANFFTGLALKTFVRAGRDSWVRLAGGAMPTLSATGRQMLLTNPQLERAFDAMDVAAYQFHGGDLWTQQPPAPSTIRASSSTDSTQDQEELPSPAAAAVPVEHALPVEPVLAAAAAPAIAPSPVAKFSASLPSDDEPIAQLLDSFAASDEAPSAKPHLARSTLRIFLHELNLVEADPIGALRAALAGATPGFREKVIARSALYGMTSRAGRHFNNPATTPSECVALARAAKRKPDSYWTKLETAQRKEREQRWRAWVDFLAATPLANGPLPKVPW